MTILQKINNFIKPSPVAKPVRERDRIKPFKGNRNDAGVFGYTDDGFTIAQNEGASKIHWHEVARLTAYKKDLISYDEICLDITHGSNKFTVTEDTPGWHLFVEKTKAVYPVIDKEWDAKIAYPSFATNLTVIYEK